MLAASAVLTCMHATVRHVSDGMHPFEITFFRNLFGLFAILPLAIRAGIGSLRSRQPGLQILRSAFGLIAMLTWFYGLSVVPIAQATALSFTAVIFGSIGAALVLGERMRLRRWSAVVAGFVGALVDPAPGLRRDEPCRAHRGAVVDLLGRRPAHGETAFHHRFGGLHRHLELGAADGAVAARSDPGVGHAGT